MRTFTLQWLLSQCCFSLSFLQFFFFYPPAISVHIFFLFFPLQNKLFLGNLKMSVIVSPPMLENCSHLSPCKFFLLFTFLFLWFSANFTFPCSLLSFFAVFCLLFTLPVLYFFAEQEEKTLLCFSSPPFVVLLLSYLLFFSSLTRLLCCVFLITFSLFCFFFLVNVDSRHFTQTKVTFVYRRRRTTGAG